MIDRPIVHWQLAAVLPDNRAAYRVLVDDRERLTVYISATGRRVRVFDNQGRELKS